MIHRLQSEEETGNSSSSVMFPLSETLGSRLCIILLLFHVILTRVCGAPSVLVGPSQPVVAPLGRDAVLPCELNPAEDAAAMTLEWTRPDLEPRFVFVWRTGQELRSKKNPAFEGRTSLFTDELHNGNISLKLSEVRLSDAGTFRCFIPAQEEQTLVELLVASHAAAAPVVTLTGLDGGGVVLECESAGWFPEPELLWLDAEGNLLSAGPTETVRGSDDLYTVSSRVTVEKRHSSRYTCRVQQTATNHNRQVHIHVPEVFFTIQTTSSSMTLAFAVSLSLCIVSLLTLFVWKLFNTIKSKRRQRSRRDEGGKRIRKTEDEDDGEDEYDEEPLMVKTTEVETVKVEQLEEEKNESEKRVNDLKKKLEVKKKEFEMKPAELQQQQDKIKLRQKELTSLRNQLENKKKELVSIKATSPYWYSWSSTKETHQRSMKEAESQVESLKNELQRKEKDLETEIKQFDDQQSTVINLAQDVNQLMKSNSAELKTTRNELNTMMEKLNQTERHVDQLLAENKQLRDEKLQNEARLQQKELETRR